MAGCPFHDDKLIDFLKQGYPFANTLRSEMGVEGDQPMKVKALGQPALVVRGREAVRLFYNNQLVKRKGAMPSFIQGSLFGKDSVHTLDDEEHLHRKATFVKVCYTDEQVARIKPMVEAEVREAMHRWKKHPDSVYDSAVIAYGRASMRWAGIVGHDQELDKQARRFGDIVEGFAHLGVDHLKSWVNRRLTDSWCAKVIQEQRDGVRTAAPGTALYEWANHRELDGQLLDAKTAGIEMQNCFRPHIAVARFAAFAAKALHDHPQWRADIAAETAERGTLVDGPLAVAFAQEVRRFYPFVPLLPAFARTDFEFQGEQVAQGERILIDIYNTDKDPSTWERAEEFDPARFLGVEDYEAIETFVPHGGGDVATGHRCPGEKIAISSLATMTAALASDGVTILDQGLDVDYSVMPTKPSGALVTAS